MTDRPALARLLADEAERRGQLGLVERLARVLAEHDTAPSSGYCGCRDLGDGTGMECVAHEEQRLALEAAEARCAQLEQDRDFQRARADKWVAVVEKHAAVIERLQEHLADSEAPAAKS